MWSKTQNYMTNDLNLVLKVKFKAGKMVLWLRTLAALLEDLDSILSTNKAAHVDLNFSFMGFDALFWLSKALRACIAQTNMQTKHPYT